MGETSDPASVDFILVPINERTPGARENIGKYRGTYCPICGRPRWFSVPLEDAKRYYYNYLPLNKDGMHGPRYSYPWLSIPPACTLRIEVGLEPGEEMESNIGDIRVTNTTIRQDIGLDPIDACDCQ